jgi:hypothetical protein
VEDQRSLYLRDATEAQEYHTHLRQKKTEFQKIKNRDSESDGNPMEIQEIRRESREYDQNPGNLGNTKSAVSPLNICKGH